jgi:hypothetical protein
MTDNTYNGWTNYATWRVNLEIFDGIDPREMGWCDLSIFNKYDLAPVLKDYAEEIISVDCKEGLAMSYALAFISEVNFREIADMMIEAYADEKAVA